MKIRSVGAELFHSDGRTDMTKLTVAFRSFTKEPENVSSIIGMAGGMNWIDLAQYRNRWRALVHAVVNLRVP